MSIQGRSKFKKGCWCWLKHCAAWRSEGEKEEAGLSSGLSVMRTNNGNCLVDHRDAGHTQPHLCAFNCEQHTPTPIFNKSPVLVTNRQRLSPASLFEKRPSSAIAEN